MTASASSNQMSAAGGTTIVVNASASTTLDNSGCANPSQCLAQNQGVTNFKADFRIDNPTAYT